jgi:hypothetical protein
MEFWKRFPGKAKQAMEPELPSPAPRFPKSRTGEGSDPQGPENEQDGDTFLVCEVLPEGVTLSGMAPDDRLRLDQETDLIIGNSECCDLVVRGIRIGGQRNCRLQWTGPGRWELSHLGHALPIRVNGAVLRDGSRTLLEGDWFQPVGHDGEGPRFKLLRELPVGAPVDHSPGD